MARLPLPLHGPMLPEDYLALVTIHGTIMLFFVLTTAPQAGFATSFSLNKSARAAWPSPGLNAASFWLTALALLILLSSTFVPGGAAISGWTAYPPSAQSPAPAPAKASAWTSGSSPSLSSPSPPPLSSINTLTTIIRNRAPA